MSAPFKGVSEATPQFVQRSTSYADKVNGFGRVHATRNGTSTCCGKQMQGEWGLLEDIQKAMDEQNSFSSLPIFCEVCRNAKNVSNPGKIQEGEVGKKKTDYQKDLLPMWDGKQKTSSPTTQSYGQAGFSYSGNTCTHNGTKVMCILERDIRIAGAKGADVDYDAADIVIDCAGITKKDFNNPAGSVVSGTTRLVDAVKESITHPDTLFIDWPDMKTPKVGPRFWQSLLAAIPDKSRVVICCVGSHGRTGTAMACLIAANSVTLGRDQVPDAVDIIKFVRKNHCSKAVETQSQEDYVAKIVANYKDPGNPEEVKRQWALNDAAFKKPVSGVATISPKAVTQDEQKSSPKKQESSKGSGDKYEWVDALVQEMENDLDAQTAEVASEDEIMFVDAGGNVVNESGDVVFEKGKLSPEEREWAKELPTWSEYIQKRYEQGKEVASITNNEGDKNGN